MSKFLKFFDNNVQRSTYELSEQYVSPYVSAIKGINGGGVEPRYNLPSDILCVLTLKDNSTIYITGEETLSRSDIYPYNQDVVRAIITNKCTSISQQGFYDCIHLSSVIIPDSVTTIGYYAFYKCSSLSSITLSNNITKLESSTFSMCKSLEHISLPNKLEYLGNYIFYNCGLKELIIPEGVKEIESGAINTCHNLESITFPSSLIRISESVFLNDCEKLREIKIMGTKDINVISNYFSFIIRNKSDLTLYVDSSLVDAYKTQRDRVNGLYKILPLQQ